VLGNVDGKDILCSSKMTASVEEMNKSFCSSHIRQEVKQYKLEKIKKEKALKKEEKEAQKKQKEEEKDAQKNQFLKIKESLKMLKKVKNVVTSQTIEIPTFEGIEQVSNLCQTILKSGPRKGQTCGNKALKNVSGCCSRHNVLAPVLETEINNI
jgi:DNA polymerase II small subunit/DNA polymerase delta subunit B